MAVTTPAETYTPVAEPRPGRRRRRAAAALTLGLALAGGGVAAVVVPERGGSAAPPAWQIGVVAPAPADVTWETVNGRSVPASPTAGPTRTDGAVRSGFAHTPTGAALAALNISTRFVFTPGDGWLDVTLAQVVPGKGRAAHIKNRKAVEWTTPAGGWGQTAGYRVLDYTADTAVVQEALRFPDGTLRVQQLTVVWRDADWRLELQRDGSGSPFVADVRNLSGFTPLSRAV